MFMLSSNEPIKNYSPSKIGQSINGEWRTCDRNGNNSLSKRSSDEARNVLIEKKWNKDIGSENFISTRFRYISKLFRGAKEQENW